MARRNREEGILASQGEKRPKQPGPTREELQLVITPEEILKAKEAKREKTKDQMSTKARTVDGGVFRQPKTEVGEA